MKKMLLYRQEKKCPRLEVEKEWIEGLLPSMPSYLELYTLNFTLERSLKVSSGQVKARKEMHHKDSSLFKNEEDHQQQVQSTWNSSSQFLMIHVTHVLLEQVNVSMDFKQTGRERKQENKSQHFFSRWQMEVMLCFRVVFIVSILLLFGLQKWISLSRQKDLNRVNLFFGQIPFFSVYPGRYTHNTLISLLRDWKSLFCWYNWSSICCLEWNKRRVRRSCLLFSLENEKKRKSHVCSSFWVFCSHGLTGRKYEKEGKRKSIDCILSVSCCVLCFYFYLKSCSCRYIFSTYVLSSSYHPCLW